MGVGCPEKLDIEFIKWIIGFRKSSRPKILAELGGISSPKNVKVFTSPRQLKAFITQLKTSVNYQH